LINANTVVTAGRCVNNSGGWSTNVWAYPGYTGSSASFGACSARTLYSVTGWTVDRNPDYDYGAVKLNCSVGNSTGWLGFRWQSASLNGLPIHEQGYPPDKGWGQWRDDGSIYRTNTNTTGSSYTTGFTGAPLFDNNLYAVSIYTGTGSVPPTCSGNICTGTSELETRGTRITQSAYNNLLNWRNL